MNWFYLHVVLMLTATALLLTGVVVAGALRNQHWWLKAHRRIGLGGGATMAAGFVAAIVLVSLSGQVHFGPPHTWLGGASLIGVFLTPALGHASFRFPAHGAVLRGIHRLSGRLTAILATITLVSGLFLAGIL